MGFIRLSTGSGGNPGGQSDACQLIAILIWMHNGLRYIYSSTGLNGLMRERLSRRGSAPKGSEDEHRTIYRQRSEVERRRAVYEGHAAVSTVRFLRAGGADPRSCRGRL